MLVVCPSRIKLMTNICGLIHWLIKTLFTWLLINCSKPSLTTTLISPTSQTPLTPQKHALGAHWILQTKKISYPSVLPSSCYLQTFTMPRSILCKHSRLLLSTGWSWTCALVFLFPKLGMVPSEESLPVPITGVLQVLPFPALLGITTGAGTGVVGLLL